MPYENDYNTEGGVAASRSGTRRGRKGRRARQRRALLFANVLLLVLLVGAVLIGAYLYLRGRQPLPGIYRMRVDVTAQALASGQAWLSAADMGDEIDFSAYFGGASVDVLRVMEADGSYLSRVDEASYEAAAVSADAALASALRELLLRRITAAGRTAVDAEDAEALIQQTIGISTEAYLRDYGPALLPPLSDLQGVYDRSGGYTVEKERIFYDDGSSCAFLLNDTTLVLVLDEDGDTEVYERVQEPDAVSECAAR